MPYLFLYAFLQDQQSKGPLYAGRNAEGTTDGRSHDDDYFEDDPPDGFLFVLFFHEIVDYEIYEL